MDQGSDELVSADPHKSRRPWDVALIQREPRQFPAIHRLYRPGHLDRANETDNQSAGKKELLRCGSIASRHQVARQMRVDADDVSIKRSG